jgi:hypothetical protein
MRLQLIIQFDDECSLSFQQKLVEVKTFERWMFEKMTKQKFIYNLVRDKS